MDLSKVPDLELRQKIKPLNDRLAAIEEQIEAMRKARDEKFAETTKSLDAEREKLDESIIALLADDDRWVDGKCYLTGLPLFNTDETIELYALACVADPVKAAA